MKRRCVLDIRLLFIGIACGLSILLAASGRVEAEGPTASAGAAFDSYCSGVEGRLALQHRSANGFIAAASWSQNEARLRRGELIVEQLASSGEAVPGAMLHHWRGTAFAPGAKAADFERLMRDFNGYPQYFAPQVLRAKVLAEQGDLLQASMRVRQRHVITVVMDTTYDVKFGRLDGLHGYSVSRSTRIDEIDSPGAASERALSSSEEHGFLWRLNTYWSYEERDGGLYMQVESVSLTRGIPTGLGWAVRPYVESVPRESLEFTLRSACNALSKKAK
jgi:hypothetical protein